QLAALAAEFPNVQAVKESSGDIRRIAAIRALIGDRLEILVGVDDIIVESIQMGATGWIAGMVNAFPEESVRLFEQAQQHGAAAVADLYAWFLPTLRLDTVPKFVQLIKLAQAEVNMGSENVRAPRLLLEGHERDAALRVIKHAVTTRPGR
ncbi:MAG: dihydrodipicolinate synthase family protein, partial [Rhodanobacter sp.]